MNDEKNKKIERLYHRIFELEGPTTDANVNAVIHQAKKRYDKVIRGVCDIFTTFRM